MAAPPIPLALLSTPPYPGVDLAQLATALDIPLVVEPQAAVLLLCATNEGLELRKPGDPLLPGCVRVDFTDRDTRRRLLHPSRELLVQAAKVRHCRQPLLIDATAGLGRDGFLLAAAGFRVLMIEANPVIAALLADGLERARRIPALFSIIDRIRLIAGNALAQLPLLQERAEVIYLDPMFPDRTKSALVKQELRLLQLLNQEIDDPEALLQTALAMQVRKVVVKRPLKGPILSAVPPTYTLRGKAIRFDVYVGRGREEKDL